MPTLFQTFDAGPLLPTPHSEGLTVKAAKHSSHSPCRTSGSSDSLLLSDSSSDSPLGASTPGPARVLHATMSTPSQVLFSSAKEKLCRLLSGLLAAPRLQGLQEALPPGLRLPGAQLQPGLGLLLGQRDLRGQQVRTGEDVAGLGHLLHHDRRDRLRVRPSPESPSVSGTEHCQHLMEDCVDDPLPGA